MTTMMALKGLQDKGLEGDLALFELAEMAKNQTYQPPFDELKAILVKFALIKENGHMHDSVRNIVFVSD